MIQIFERLHLAADDIHTAAPRDPVLWESITLQFGRHSTVAHPFSESELVQTDQMWND